MTYNNINKTWKVLYYFIIIDTANTFATFLSVPNWWTKYSYSVPTFIIIYQLINCINSYIHVYAEKTFHSKFPVYRSSLFKMFPNWQLPIPAVWYMEDTWQQNHTQLRWQGWLGITLLHLILLLWFECQIYTKNCCLFEGSKF